MIVRRVPVDPGATEEVPEADAAEQQTEVVNITDAGDRSAADDGDRVVTLDEDEYR